MTTYVVGDIQACLKGLKKLLKKAEFNPKHDTLIAVGDLIGRGPQAEQTLSFLMSLSPNFKTVLGNHDLHFLAICAGIRHAKPSDKFDTLLKSKQLPQYIDWLPRQPLALALDANTLVTHAGLYPYWSISDALRFSQEVCEHLSSDNWQDWIASMYGSEPKAWSTDLEGENRTRFIVNALTRMRFIENHNQLNFECKSSPKDAPSSLQPWFSLKNPQLTKQQKVIFGHWAALQGNTQHKQFIGLDTGYLWGQSMTLLNTSTMKKLAVKH